MARLARYLKISALGALAAVVSMSLLVASVWAFAPNPHPAIRNLVLLSPRLAIIAAVAAPFGYALGHVLLSRCAVTLGQRFTVGLGLLSAGACLLLPDGSMMTRAFMFAAQIVGILAAGLLLDRWDDARRAGARATA